MRYVLARLEQNNRDEAYRIYVAKSLQLSPQGRYLTKDYSDIVSPQKVDTRSGNDVVVDIMSTAGLTFGDKR